MDTIGLIAAMPSESQALINKVNGATRIQRCAYKGFWFGIGGQECIQITSGMGVKRAEEAARWLIQAYLPACLISFGIAGAIQPDLRVGDVVLPVQNSTLEAGSLTHPVPLTEPSSDAWTAATAELEKEHIRVVRGSAITTHGSQLASSPPGWEHPILEMETAGILRAAGPSGTPVMVIRSISDGPNDPLPFDLGKAMDEEGNLRMGALLGMMLKRPGILLKIGAMMRNSRTAADHAALAVLAILEQNIFLTREV